MKILLDECLPLRLRNFLVGHEVFSAEYMHWKGISNGRLVSLAAAAGFELILTVDRGTLHQLPAPLPIGLLVIRAKNNSLKALAPLVPRILAILPTLPPRSRTELSE